MSKIALIYDKFLVHGGGERVFRILHETFPDAEIYALNAHPRKYWESKFKKPIHTPFLGFIFRSRFLIVLLYPFACLLMATLRINSDLAFVYSSTCGKYSKLNAKKKILYSNYPNRGLYETEKIIQNKVIRFFMSPFICFMKLWETKQFKKFDQIYSISETSKNALLKFAGVKSQVLRCPFDRDAMHHHPIISNVKNLNPFFLLISRLEPEKDLTHVIEAFNNTDAKLKIIGHGSYLKFLQSKCKNNNVEFLGFVQDDQLVAEILKCSAVIFPSEIEYSLVPIEANSLGKPVIAFDSSASREILFDIKIYGKNGTAVFYPNKNGFSLLAALDYFKSCKWNKDKLIKNSLRFSPEQFKSELLSIVDLA
jgi:glycosyltransferase involved in cell wall biosynthesis